jgi:homoserine kinase
MGVFLSGAGPTIMSIIKDEDLEFGSNINSYLKSLNCNWDVINLKCDNKGALLNIL